MKNITLRVEEEVLLAVRRYAAERHSTVNALVRSHLTEIARREDRARIARERIRALSEQSTAERGAQHWTRAELHER
jgi:hypothetical protein